MFMKFGRTSRVALAALGVLGLVAAAQAAGAQQAGPLETQLSAFSVQPDKAAPEGERLEPAASVNPGGLVEYRVSYANVGEAELSGLVINGVIPDQTDYVDASARLDVSSVLEVRAEGTDWAMPPLTRYETMADGTILAVVVPPAEYTALRWKLAQPLAPGDRIEAVYRVAVDQ